ncbi:hypothetical protein PT2222_410005 [Paraburkholderia tropica]
MTSPQQQSSEFYRHAGGLTAHINTAKRPTVYRWEPTSECPDAGVRAGRIDEFHLDSNSGSHIIITNWQAVEISSAHVIRAGRVNVEPKSQTTLRLRQCAERTAIPSRCSRCPGWITSLRPITRCDRFGNG